MEAYAFLRSYARCAVLNLSAVLVSLAMAIAVSLFGDDRRVKPWVVTMCLACAALSAGLWIEVHVPRYAVLSARVNMTAALVLAGSAVISARTMIVLPTSRVLLAVLAIAGLLNVATVWATDLYFSGELLHYPWGVFVGANPRFIANPLLVTLIAGYGVLVLARHYRSAHPLEKNRTKYMLAAFTALSLSVLDYVPHFGVAPFGAPVGAIFITAFLFLFGYACLRYRLVVFRELMGRAVGFMLSLGAMALAYALAIEGARRSGASITVAPLAGTLSAVAIYALIGRALPDWTQRVLGGREPDYPAAIRAYSDRVTSIFDEAEVLAATRETCRAVFDAGDAQLVAAGALPVDAPIVELEVLKRTQSVEASGFEVLFPIHRRDEVTGALAIGRRTDGGMYSAHALSSLRTLANVLGMALANARAAGELAERYREVTLLNDELRRQITDRSQKLADALHRVGALPARDGRLHEGQTIDDRYTVVRILGAGGMGAVYEVTRVSDGRRLAMKTLTAATTGTSLARLAREAEIASKIVHPNLVSIVDVDVSSVGDLYIVMELVDGRSLYELRGRYGDVRWALPILRQIADGLAALHAGGVVHRDLKPGNVLVTSDDRVKILDFGIARVADTSEALAETLTPTDPTLPAQQPISSQPLTETGVVMGTPLYMAPELALGAKDAQPSSDMWSFGVVAYELLVGTTPFTGVPLREAPNAMEKAVVALAPLLPESMATALCATLAMAPADRPTAAHVVNALAERTRARSAISSTT
jgi:hypothetical protein